MSILTKEGIQKILNDDWLLMDDCEGLENCTVIKELARMALDAMDNEPVAWTDEEELRDVNVAGIGYLFGIDREANKFADPRRQIMLYRHAQPAPEKYNIGDTTMRHIFTPTGMTNVSNMQAVFDRVEAVLVGMEQPAPVVPDENVSFHRLPGESEYDRLNRQREWMESKSKLAKVTAAAPDDLTERLLRLRAQAMLDGSYLDAEEWDSLACDVIKALNACRAAMLNGGNDE